MTVRVVVLVDVSGSGDAVTMTVTTTVVGSPPSAVVVDVVVTVETC